MRICDVFDQLEVGMEVETYGDALVIGKKLIRGKIGLRFLDKIFIFTNDIANYHVECISEITPDYTGSWFIHKSCPARIEILNTKHEEKSMSNLIKRCKELFLSEPEKSFRKVGIAGDDGSLTGEGEKVFLDWLLKINSDKFKAEVVDKIIEDKEDK
jgi:hypothetical protein